MKTVSAFLLLASLLSSATPDASFVGGLSTAERVQIGVENLDPAQLAALEAAVQRYVVGRQEDAVEEATAAVRTELADTLSAKEQELVVAREQLAQKQETAANGDDSGSLLQRARVLLTPGTQIEYTTVSSTLTEPFQGWKSGTLFRLANGQVWRVMESKYWSPREEAGKAVTIKPGVLGSFFLEIEGVRQTPRVELVSRN